jgi:5-methylcytosine-specific restriction protein A
MGNRNAYLFIWNLDSWEIGNLIPVISDLKINGVATDNWRIAAHKKVKIGDKAFITRVYDKQNKVKRGIFASGEIIKKDVPIFVEQSHKTVPGVVIKFDTFLHPVNDEILDIKTIENNTPIKQRWSLQSSGTQIKPGNVNALENLWKEFREQNHYDNTILKHAFIEGTPYQVIQTAYERDQEARAICLQLHGYACLVCDFNFKDKYGDLGNEFIHVHHLNPARFGERFTDPEKDLQPFCPNCHSMLHKRNPPYTINELREKIKTASSR